MSLQLYLPLVDFLSPMDLSCLSIPTPFSNLFKLFSCFRRRILSRYAVIKAFLHLNMWNKMKPNRGDLLMVARWVGWLIDWFFAHFISFIHVLIEYQNVVPTISQPQLTVPNIYIYIFCLPSGQIPWNFKHIKKPQRMPRLTEPKKENNLSVV